MSPQNAVRSAGQETEFNIILTNDGPEDVSGVSVDALLPTGLAYVSDNGGGNYNDVTGLWTIPGTIASGDRAVAECRMEIVMRGMMNVIRFIETGDAVDVVPPP